LSKECQLAGILVEIAAVFTFAPFGSPDCKAGQRRRHLTQGKRLSCGVVAASRAYA